MGRRSPAEIFVLISIGLIIASVKTVFGKNHPNQTTPFYYGTFPSNFEWGFSSSAFQTEGAWNLDGKSETHADRYYHSTLNQLLGRATPDVACDSYHKYKGDIQLMKKMGAGYYKFSISWSRILPEGKRGSKINQAGVDFYNSLINELIANGITPVATMYHFDLPQCLEDIGGWPNEALISHFVYYAQVLFEQFGDRVKRWITFGEPWAICQFGYGYGVLPPGDVEPKVAPYRCGHTLIKAHAVAFRIYDRKFRKAQQGTISIAYVTPWCEADQNTATHLAAAERCMQFIYGWFANPLVNGEYPPIMRKLIDEKSVKEGRRHSKLPSFSPLWTKIINGTLDHHSINFYSTVYVRPGSRKIPGIMGDANVLFYFDFSSPTSAAGWIQTIPWGFRKTLNWIAKEYRNPDIYVVESGFASTNGTEDDDKINLIRLYSNEVLKALKLDGVNVKGYYIWTIVDSFELLQGYKSPFGLYHVDFSDPERPRTPRKSVKFVRQLFKDNGFPRKQ